MATPILYSFRRCPYAMRARLAVASAGITCELREIVLRDKAPEFLATSPKGTVPVLIDGDLIIEESRDVMRWALARNDPENWLNMPSAGDDLIDQADEPFKSALDRYKYASRFEQVTPNTDRAVASEFLFKLDKQLVGQHWLFGQATTLADMAILPFVRQFAHVDLEWFTTQPWPELQRWLDAFKASTRFAGIMQKYPKWQVGDAPTYFPPQ